MIESKRVSGKPHIQPSKAIVGRPNVAKYMAIDPASTPVKSYTKRTK